MKRNILVGILIVLILGTGLVVGIFLVQQNQLFNQKASSPSGTGTVSLSPATGTYDINSTNPVSIYFNTNGVSVSGITVGITYSNLSMTASNIQIGQTLLAGGDWACPVKNITATGSTSEVDLACVNTSPAGFSSTSDTLLGTFDLTANNVPVLNPLIISFVSENTVMTQKSDGTDIALTPSSTGSYTITNNISESPTPTGLIVVASPTPTDSATAAPSGSATASPTPTSSPLASATNSPTSNPSATNPPLPVTGFDTPTIIGGVAGVLLLIISAAALIL
ncbi:hypothetical protein BH10PAT1_BH10PAT1_0170 [soil metagenome]